MSVIIGMDPHKSSATIEVVDERGTIQAVGRYGTDKAGYAEMLKAGRKFDNRIWAIEGLQRHRQTHRAPPGPPRRDRRRCATEAVRPGPGVRHRQRPQDRPC